MKSIHISYPDTIEPSLDEIKLIDFASEALSRLDDESMRFVSTDPSLGEKICFLSRKVKDFSYKSFVFASSSSYREFIKNLKDIIIPATNHASKTAQADLGLAFSDIRAMERKRLEEEETKRKKEKATLNEAEKKILFENIKLKGARQVQESEIGNESIILVNFKLFFFSQKNKLSQNDIKEQKHLSSFRKDRLITHYKILFKAFSKQNENRLYERFTISRSIMEAIIISYTLFTRGYFEPIAYSLSKHNESETVQKASLFMINQLRFATDIKDVYKNDVDGKTTAIIKNLLDEILVETFTNMKTANIYPVSQSILSEIISTALRIDKKFFERKQIDIWREEIEKNRKAFDKGEINFPN